MEERRAWFKCTNNTPLRCEKKKLVGTELPSHCTSRPPRHGMHVSSHLIHSDTSSCHGTLHDPFQLGGVVSGGQRVAAYGRREASCSWGLRLGEIPE